ncbi:MAG: metal-binding protein [Eubacteriales bacterium]|nr:metal-binding protein [Eubacteriales bacterium]
MKQYKLLGVDGKEYISEVPGLYGGNGAGKIYGMLDCKQALRALREAPDVYKKTRVFFADEKDALANGYRPCGSCLRSKYKEYIADPDAYRSKFGLK